MALGRIDFQITDVLFRRHQRIDQFPRAGRGEAPVGGKRHHTEPGAGVGEGGGEVVVEVGGRIKVVQRFGHQQVGVGVEAPGKLLALIPQVAFDLELHAVEVVVEVLVLQAPAEFLTHRVIGQVRDVPDHARQHQAALGDHAVLLKRAAVEFRVRQNCLPRDFVEGDILSRQLGCGSNRQTVPHALGVGDRPLQRLHAAQTAADDGGPLIDAQPVGKPRLAVHPVFDRQHGKVGAEGPAGFRVEAAGTGGAIASAEVVQADDEELISVDRLAGADATVPPARLTVFWAVVARRVVMTRKRVTNQYRVAFGGVELTVSFVDEIVGRQRASAGQGQRLIEMRRLRRD